MPSKIPKKEPPIGFTVNGKTCTSSSGFHDVKWRRGRQAILLRVGPEGSAASPASESPSAPVALQSQDVTKPLSGCTICAVDVYGRFLIDANQEYVAGVLRSVEEQASVCKQYRGKVRVYPVRETPSEG